MQIRSIIIPAAGLGTRLLPATKVVPKELLNVYDRPVLQFAIDEAINAGAERIIVVIHPDKLAIRDYLKPDEDYVGRLRAGGNATLSAALAAVQVPETVDLVFAFQNSPLGLGHAISVCSKLALPGPVGVILPDDVIMGTPCMAEMAQAYRGGHMVAAMAVTALDAPRYGIFRLLGTPSGQSVAVSGMVEKPKAGTEPSLLAAVGRYVLDPVIFTTLLGIPRGAGGEVQLTDAIAADAARLPLTAFRFSGHRYDCGSHDGLIEAGLARQRAVKRERSVTGAAISAARLTAKINDCPTAARRIDGQTAALEGTAP
ncbi:MAG: Nucleotidyl transferase [Rhodobacteraceae bacterium]|uniref:UTP--glucose-1-phosphate uridylyltransferase n=1 Tax=Cypionkella sp. TaxID=2811411 RepID=UPI0013246E19|nr:sugar phosphate nucleotidyltransferase [Cypionkella sp.]KAF0174886.1 MAG: Nucleotidyl transferase [Paracoccaceae bacterium]MDO8326145.1 sugar phosphate nucleotidyltransferase [Cypionkella sp.]